MMARVVFFLFELLPEPSHLQAWAQDYCHYCCYLDPKSMLNNSPKHIIIAMKAITLHTFGVQVFLLHLDARVAKIVLQMCVFLANLRP